MKRTTKILGSATGMLAVAAFAGLVAGASHHATAAQTSMKQAAKVSFAGTHARTLDDNSKHDCKGKNDCKGLGGCNAGDQGCKGKNTCKGKGGCKTNGNL